MITRICSVFLRNIRRFIPMLIVLALVAVAAATDVFSLGLQQAIRQALVDYAHKLMPFAIDMLIAAVLVNLAWVFYKPMTIGVEKVLEKTHASPRGKDLALKLFKFFYWMIVVFLVLSLTAAEFLGRFVVGFGVFGAALTLSMQGAANDFICGLLIQFCRKVTEGDQVKIEGLDVKGKVAEVGMLSTTVDTATDVIRVPNREVWARAVKTEKPAKSKIILPPGVDYPERS